MRASDATNPDRAASRGAVVGGDDDCEHPSDARAYLGHMGTAAFYRCTVCDGAVVTW